MSRPAQLEQQIARVKELQAEMLEGDKPPVDDQGDNDAGTTPPEPAKPAAVVEMPATVSKEEFDKLEQRYRTLQGMHNADVNRYRGEISTLQSALQDLEDRVVAAENAAKTSTYTPAKYVTAEDEEEYGDTLEMVRRAAREEAENIAAKREQAYLDRIAQLEQQIGHVQNTVVPKVEDLTTSRAEQIKAEFWAAINAQVPDWQTINQDPKFREWLLDEDQVTGANRQQFLSQAQKQLNAQRVIRFFEEWKRTQAGGQTPAPKKTAQSDLEKLVAPGTSKGGAAVVQPEKKTWTHADIGAFYADVTRGKYINRPEERKKIENDIFAAQAEGRVA